MTTVRRIVVSQIDGDTANNTNINEIRPFGETAFYLDQDFETQKLTLMMFNGQRTHRESKVLAPGVLWGSSADSGDGNNYDTIKLIPDAELFANGSNQYIVVDPTSGVPGHIHIRAGGTQDASGADLYIGGEQTFVRVSDTNDNVVIRTTALGNTPIENVNVQTVDELVPPGNVWRLFINDSIYPTLGNTVQIGETVTTAWGTPITATITDIQQDAGNWQIHVDQNIVTGFNAGPQTVTFNRGSRSWTFDSTGVLTFPDGFLTIQDSQGGVIVKAADGKNISLMSSGAGLTGSAIGWYDNFVVPTKLAAVVANNPLYVGEGDVGILTGGLGTNTNIWNFAADGTVTLPGGGGIDGSDYDVEIIAGNDGSSTFGSVTINTQAPPTVYSVVQQTSPLSFDTITTDIGSTPFIGNIVAGMTVTGAGITTTTTVTNVTGPDEYGTFFISVSPASDTGLNYTETYTFTSAGGVTNRTWDFNSLGEIYLPRGGVIQETDVTNEAFGTTTTSLTLVPAGAANGTQRLEIYSTAGGEGNHIHITSGDQNQTDLYLGNDTQYFAVGAMGQMEIRARPGLASPSPGAGAYSGSPVWIYAGNAGDNGGNTADGASGGDIFLQAGISSAYATGGQIILQSGNGPAGYGSIILSTNGGSSNLEFDKDDQLTFPSGGGIIFDNSATSTITGVSEVIFADGTTQTTAFTGTSALLDILNTNGIDTNYYLTFVENRVAGQEVRADVDLTFNSWSNTLGVGKISVNSAAISTSTTTGALTVAGGIGVGGNVTLGGSLNFADGTTQSTAYTGTSVSIYLLEAYANVTYTLPGSFTEDVCRYSVVSGNVNVPSAWFNTSTYTFTPLKAGYWEITAAYDVYRNAEASMVIKKNTSIVASAGSFNAVAQQVTKIVYLNGSTDYIQIYNFGGAALERSQYDGRSWFQARWVGV